MFWYIHTRAVGKQLTVCICLVCFMKLVPRCPMSEAGGGSLDLKRQLIMLSLSLVLILNDPVTEIPKDACARFKFKR